MAYWFCAPSLYSLAWHSAFNFLGQLHSHWDKNKNKNISIKWYDYRYRSECSVHQTDDIRMQITCNNSVNANAVPWNRYIDTDSRTNIFTTAMQQNHDPYWVRRDKTTTLTLNEIESNWRGKEVAKKILFNIQLFHHYFCKIEELFNVRLYWSGRVKYNECSTVEMREPFVCIAIVLAVWRCVSHHPYAQCFWLFFFILIVALLSYGRALGHSAHILYKFFGYAANCWS